MLKHLILAVGLTAPILAHAAIDPAPPAPPQVTPRLVILPYEVVKDIYVALSSRPAGDTGEVVTELSACYNLQAPDVPAKTKRAAFCPGEADMLAAVGALNRAGYNVVGPAPVAKEPAPVVKEPAPVVKEPAASPPSVTTAPTTPAPTKAP